MKPLFTAQLSDGSLAFASELKGLLAHPLLRREPIRWRWRITSPGATSPITARSSRGVEKLPAGHYRLLRHDAPPAAPVRWWDVSFAERHRGSEADLEAELLHHLREAVTSRMIADVPLGAFLSGGVDSSSGRRADG